MCSLVFIQTKIIASFSCQNGLTENSFYCKKQLFIYFITALETTLFYCKNYRGSLTFLWRKTAKIFALFFAKIVSFTPQ